MPWLVNGDGWCVTTDVEQWDHTGDPSLFPPSTEVVVGSGFKEAFMPGYPTNEDSPMLDSDFEYEARYLARSELMLTSAQGTRGA